MTLQENMLNVWSCLDKILGELHDFRTFCNRISKQYIYIHSYHYIIVPKCYRFIHSKNRANLGYELEVNHFADRDDLEMKALRGNVYDPGSKNNGKPFPYSQGKIKAIFKDLPDSLDWRLNGAVTPVKGKNS